MLCTGKRDDGVVGGKEESGSREVIPFGDERCRRRASHFLKET